MVIAIIGVLVGLLLPAVQAARESARGAQCLDHLKQIALAAVNYEQSARSLPAAGSFPPRETAVHFSYSYRRIDLRSGNLHSWATRILPYLEQQSLFHQFDFAKHICDNPANPQARQPAVMLCPSDQAFGRTFEYHAPDGARIATFGKGNYAGFASPFHVDGVSYRGAIWLYGIKLSDVVDGTSDTLMLGEIRTRDDERDQRGAWALPFAGASLLAVDMHFPDFGRSQDEGDSGYRDDPRSLGFTQRPNSDTPDVLYECPDLAAEQLEAMPCSNQYWGYISAAPRSHHPAGVHVAYVDGHAGFLADGIDETAMAYQAAIDDESVHGAP